MFQGREVFTEFVSEIYSIKKNSPKGSPMNIVAKLLLNSLYGRFGMNPFTEKNLVIAEDQLHEFSSKFTVLDFKDFGDGKLLISYVDKSSNSEVNSNNKNISVAIASAITAYSRVKMTLLKNNPDFPIYYYDTDSYATDRPLPDNIIGKEIGQFKVENILQDAVFAAPKLYGGITVEGNEFTKVKGYKNKVAFADLKKLLNKDELLKLNHEKWYKSIHHSNITIMNQVYNLTLTENKRQLIYDDKGTLVATKPFIVNELINRNKTAKIVNNNENNISESEDSMLDD